MRRFNFLFCIVVVISTIFVFSCTSSKRGSSQQKILDYNSEHFFFAHKGILSLYPENTMSAFKEAERIGCKGIELDIRQTADGVIVISHDNSVAKLTNGTGKISKKTNTKIQGLLVNKNTSNLTRPEHIATLEEYLQWVRNTDIYTNIELKTEDTFYRNIEKKAVELVERYNLQDRVIFSSTNPLSLVYIMKCNPNLKTGLIADARDIESLYLCIDLGLSAFHTGPNISDENLKLCHDNGLLVNSFCGYNEEQWLQLFERGIDSITTDFYYVPEEIK